MNVERDFPEKPVEADAVRLALADLLLGETSRAAYQKLIGDKLHVAEAWEGIGLIALRAGQKDAALAAFDRSMAADAQSARVYIEYARLAPDTSKAVPALEKAVKLNAKLAEPHFLMSQRTSDLDKRITHLKAAVALDARRADWWQALAEAYLAAHDYSSAAKAWRSAEQASTDDRQRERMRQARLAIEQQRLDYEAAERRRQEEEKARETERLKAEARAELRALEARVNQGKESSGDKPVPWWDGPKPSGHARGMLKQVDCLGKQARLIVETEDRKTTRLLVPDASQVTVLGEREQTLGCGAQKPRRVAIEYFPKTNAKLATVGEVATIEFQ